MICLAQSTRKTRFLNVSDLSRGQFHWRLVLSACLGTNWFDQDVNLTDSSKTHANPAWPTSSAHSDCQWPHPSQKPVASADASPVSSTPWSIRLAVSVKASHFDLGRFVDSRANLIDHFRDPQSVWAKTLNRSACSGNSHLDFVSFAYWLIYLPKRGSDWVRDQRRSNHRFHTPKQWPRPTSWRAPSHSKSFHWV